jgi:cytochrome P450
VKNDDPLGDAGFLTDPLPILHELQDRKPLYWSSAWGVWVLTRYEDTVSVLEDPATYSSESRFTTLLDRLPASVQPRIARLRRHYSYGLIQSDPPTHTRLRRMVRDAFTPRAMAAFQPRVASLTDTLIDRFADRGSADLMEELAYVLPISVMSELMAVPAADRQLFIEWDAAISGIQATGAAQAERALAANAAIIAIEDYFLALARRRRQQPGPDLLSLMLTGHHGIEPLGDEELMAMCVGLLLGGHETTRSLIGNLMLSVLQRPALLTEVRRRPEIIPHVVEEVLRFESPIQRGWRRVIRDVQLHGQHLRAGDLVYVMLGAANRDERQFESAQDFRAERRPNQHLAFGYGIHFCVGAPLARLEAAVVLERLSDRLEDLHLTGSVTWLPSVHQRTLERLDVGFNPRPARADRATPSQMQPHTLPSARAAES